MSEDQVIRLTESDYVPPGTALIVSDQAELDRLFGKWMLSERLAHCMVPETPEESMRRLVRIVGI